MTAAGVVIGAGTALVMIYSGLLFDPALLRQQLTRRSLVATAHLAIVNFLLLPVACLGLIQLVPNLPDLNLVLLTLAVMPCAPLVPAIVSMAGEAPDWPMFVFLLFALLGILLLPLLLAILPQPWAAGGLAHAESINGTQLFLYLLTGYFPLLLGIALRLFDNARGLRLLDWLRPTMPMVSAVSLLVVLQDRWVEVTEISWHQVALIIIYIVMCGFIGFAFGPRLRGAMMTRVLPSAFRNITLALAFCNTVFGQTRATSYLFTYTILLLMLVFPAVALQRRMNTRAAVLHDLR